MKSSEEEVKLSDWRINRARGELGCENRTPIGGKNRALAENRAGEGELGFSAEIRRWTLTDRRLRISGKDLVINSTE